MPLSPVTASIVSCPRAMRATALGFVAMLCSVELPPGPYGVPT